MTDEPTIPDELVERTTEHMREMASDEQFGDAVREQLEGLLGGSGRPEWDEGVQSVIETVSGEESEALAFVFIGLREDGTVHRARMRNDAMFPFRDEDGDIVTKAEVQFYLDRLMAEMLDPIAPPINHEEWEVIRQYRERTQDVARTSSAYEDDQSTLGDAASDGVDVEIDDE